MADRPTRRRTLHEAAHKVDLEAPDGRRRRGPREQAAVPEAELQHGGAQARLLGARRRPRGRVGGRTAASGSRRWRTPSATSSPTRARPCWRSARSASCTATSAPARCTPSRRSSPPTARAHPTPAGVYGVVSLIFWALMIVVSIKYAGLHHARPQPRRRRDHGADGAAEAQPGARTRRVLVTLGIFGAALFFGDGIITPAISVLGALAGSAGRDAQPRASGRADLGRDPDRAVRAPAVRLGHGSGGCSAR